MKTLITIFGLCILGFGAFAAPSHADSSRARDYVSARIVAAYLASTAAKGDAAQKEAFTNIAPALANCGIDAPPSLAQQDSLTSPRFKAVVGAFLAAAQHANAEGLFVVAPELTASDTVKKIHAALSDEIKSYYAEHNSAEAKVKPMEGGFFRDNTEILFFVLAIAVILLGIVLSLRIRELNKRLNRQRKDIEELKSTGSNRTGHEGVPQGLTSDIRTLKDKVNALERTVADLDKRADVRDNRKPNQATAPPRPEPAMEAAVPTPPPPTDRNVFYMGTPYNDLFLSNSKQEEYRKGYAMYRFQPLANRRDEALFEFISDEETLKLIRNNNLDVVRTACKMMGNAGPDTKYVRTTEKGQARLDGDNWKITKKASIKFE